MNTKKLIKILLVFFCLGISFLSQGQQAERKKLEIQRKRILNRIEKANRTLQESHNEAQTGMAHLKDIEGQIWEREKLLVELAKEQELLEGEISTLYQDILGKEAELMDLKEEYGEMVYIAYKANTNHQKLAYLFASRSMEQLISRINYLEHYKRARKEQIEHIQSKMDLLIGKREHLEEKQAEKRQLIKEEETQLQALTNLKAQQRRMVNNLRKTIKTTESDIQKEKKSLLRLEGAIQRAVQRQAQLEKEEIEKEVALRADFINQKGQLDWPIDGFVTAKFGKRQHPIIPDEFIQNHGIEIRASKEEKIKAVWNGEVFAITRIPDLNYVVMVLHGEYITVYANLSKVEVKMWDAIKKGDILGKVAQGTEGAYHLSFQIWHQQKKLDPELWLKK
ncbi:murein hydrolase activator EnvC family protein [Algivirga pacifica]|uniref:Peptidoglycan DD-metalloendopeptidase family protein n=1 Tax=Algivirga pacifica TaxID=1162670 RepID=A0ABP9DGX6_9BACT